LFFVVAGVCAVAGILIIRYVEEPPRTGTAEQRTSTITDNVRSAFKSDTIRSGITLIFLSQLALLVVQPIFALYVDSLEPGNTHTATLTGAIFSTTGVFMVISSPWWGKRNDASSYRKNLTVALTGAALSCLVQGFASHAYDLIGLRALQGFCMGGILPSLYSYVSKHAPSARRGGIMGIASSSHVLASMIGPTAGGMIAAMTDLRTPFFVAGGLLLCSLLFLRLAFIDSQGRADHETGPQKPPLEGDPTPIQTDS
jgi:DHA1 family multidrug resistance protein-like MFS transporter